MDRLVFPFSVSNLYSAVSAPLTYCVIEGSFPFPDGLPGIDARLLGEEFGSLYSIWLGNQLFVIVSDPQIVKDLMVTNGAVFSSRKEMYLKSQIIFAGRGITATPYNDKWQVILKTASKLGR